MFVADETGGLRVIDAANRGNPREVAVTETGSFANGIAVSGQHVFLAEADRGMQIVDVAVPGRPLDLGFYGSTTSTGPSSWCVRSTRIARQRSTVPDCW